MPRIIIQTEGTQQHAPAATLSERLAPADARSDHYLDQLIERIAWALLDAEDLEAANASAAVVPASHRRQRETNPRLADAAMRATRSRRRLPVPITPRPLAQGS